MPTNGDTHNSFQQPWCTKAKDNIPWQILKSFSSTSPISNHHKTLHLQFPTSSISYYFNEKHMSLSIFIVPFLQIKSSLLYSLCTRIVPLWALLIINNYLSKKKKHMSPSPCQVKYAIYNSNCAYIYHSEENCRQAIGLAACWCSKKVILSHFISHSFFHFQSTSSHLMQFQIDSIFVTLRCTPNIPVYSTICISYYICCQSRNNHSNCNF